MGYPTSDELATRNNDGRFNTFEGGSIYWSSRTNKALAVWGLIRDEWARTGYETGYYGFPTSPERASEGIYSQDFEHGTISIIIPNSATYNRDAAVSYANQWSNNTSVEPHNPAYPFYDGEDCTNFTSQALRAGGLPFSSDINYWNSDADYKWGKYDFFGTRYTKSFTYAPSLYQYLTANAGAEGKRWGRLLGMSSGAQIVEPLEPFGVTNGDVIFYRFPWVGKNEWSHAMPVVGTGQVGGGDPVESSRVYYPYATLVDGHSNNRRAAHWAGVDYNHPDWPSTLVASVHINEAG